MMPPAQQYREDAEQALEALSLCVVRADGRLYGIVTSRIREVLGVRTVQSVPLAPAYVAGIVPYRGEVLTAVSLRALLGFMDARAPCSVEQRNALTRYAGMQTGCMLVLEDPEEQRGSRRVEADRFGLLVDSVGGVVTVERGCLAANPTTLNEVGRALLLGSARTDDGLLVQLDPHRLNPARLARSGLFAAAVAGDAHELKES